MAAICAREPACGHFRFCDSFHDTAASVCRNLAEGFVRFSSGEIVRFFRYALASLAEVQDHLSECLARQFIDQAEFNRLHDLSEHTKASVLSFIKPHVARSHRRRT